MAAIALETRPGLKVAGGEALDAVPLLTIDPSGSAG
jgi:hypothetical protein